MKMQELVNSQSEAIEQQYIGDSTFLGNPFDDVCPTCGAKVVSRCKCMVGSTVCENGHEWHRDRKTGRAIPGNGHKG
jgi:hypothetical protein